MDQALLSSIGRIGAIRNLRHLSLGTSGTKLTAECLKEVIGACRGLDKLRLMDVEGKP